MIVANFLYESFMVKRYIWELISNIIRNITADKQLKTLGRTFRLTSMAIAIFSTSLSAFDLNFFRERALSRCVIIVVNAVNLR